MGRPKKQASDVKPDKPVEKKVKHDTEKNRKFLGPDGLEAIGWKVSFNNGGLDCVFSVRDCGGETFQISEFFDLSGTFKTKNSEYIKDFENKVDTLQKELDVFHNSFVRMIKEYFKDELA